LDSCTYDRIVTVPTDSERIELDDDELGEHADSANSTTPRHRNTTGTAGNSEPRSLMFDMDMILSHPDPSGQSVQTTPLTQTF
jgi:hypothetical protein